MGERGAFLGKEQNLPIGPQKSTFLVSHLLHRMVNSCISYGGKKKSRKISGCVSEVVNLKTLDVHFCPHQWAGQGPGHTETKNT